MGMRQGLLLLHARGTSNLVLYHFCHGTMTMGVDTDAVILKLNKYWCILFFFRAVTL